MRKSDVVVKYNNKDITADLKPYLIDFTYTDNACDKADDLQITLSNKSGIWSHSWYPEHGAELEAFIQVENWGKKGLQALPCGKFEIDTIDIQGKPETINIKAASLPLKSALTNEDKTRAWFKTKLSLIANDIAKGAGFSLFWDCEEDQKYDRVEQTQQSDLAFLQKLSTDAGLCLKVTDKKLVIFDNRKYEKQNPIMTIDKNTTYWLSYSASLAVKETYKACTVSFKHPKKNANFSYTFTPTNPIPSGKILKINEYVQDLAQAQKLAKNRLREKNKEKDKFTLEMPGEITLLAGLTVELKNWGIFDGKWFIESAVHSIPEYKLKLELRKVLYGY